MQKFSHHNNTIAYHRYGKGTPLVLLHGYPLDHSIWSEVSALLENDFDIIQPDLRGFGISTSVNTIYSIQDMATDILSLLDSLKLYKSIFVGHSMGGYIALAMAQSQPERIKGLALVSSQAVEDTPERKQGRYTIANKVMQQGLAEVAKTMSEKLTPNPALQTYLYEIINRQNPVGVAGALKAMAERKNMMPFLAQSNIPLLLIHGMADELIPLEKARELKNHCPSAQLYEIKGAGHMPMLENPTQVAQALATLK